MTDNRAVQREGSKMTTNSPCPALFTTSHNWHGTARHHKPLTAIIPALCNIPGLLTAAARLNYGVGGHGQHIRKGLSFRAKSGDRARVAVKFHLFRHLVKHNATGIPTGGPMAARRRHRSHVRAESGSMVAELRFATRHDRQKNGTALPPCQAQSRPHDSRRDLSRHDVAVPRERSKCTRASSGTTAWTRQSE